MLPSSALFTYRLHVKVIVLNYSTTTVFNHAGQVGILQGVMMEAVANSRGMGIWEKFWPAGVLTLGISQRVFDMWE